MSRVGRDDLTVRAAERRLVLLTATRWLPVGLVFGLTVLLPLERGISLVQVGGLLAIQGVVVLALELPTGGLADALGRRPLLVASGVLAVGSTVLFAFSTEFWMFAVAMIAQGVFRALDSGPLEAWYVDTAHAADPAAPIERGLSRAATMLGVAIAVGALAGGGLVAWHPVGGVSALVVPFAVAIALYALHTVLLALLVREPPRAGAAGGAGAAGAGGVGGALSGVHSEGAEAVGRARKWGAGPALAAYREAPRVVLAGLGLLRRSPVLRAIVLVEVFWSVAMIAFETLTPVRLAGLLGGEDAAGALFGPASAAAWALFAAGSLLAGVTSRRVGVAWTAIGARILNGLFVVVMGLTAGVVGLVAAYWLAYLTHGAAGPMHSTLLHRQATSANRAVVLSMNSMVAGGAYSLGLLLFTPLAEGFGTGVAFVAAGAFSVVGALLYLPALRQENGGRPTAPVS
ncbi:MFS transporter [Herbiconiux ginsengi]|uniref:Sugar phosphate permease n=1 Tax=Herbiconiux ginsengi TaxID=381665 RepID=A0A1H3S0Z0_9MICO|nr:MFS transporter [Herbiconiux ginsengi]SDZ31723.1 Sugar phosphate permease [Herbiconiux ginsengi]